MKSKTISKNEIKIKKSHLFIKSLDLIKSNPGKIGLMILFDVLFFVSFFSMKIIFDYLNKILGVPNSGAEIFVRIIFFLIYFLALLIAYSFFKYSILDFIKSLFEESQFSLKKFGQFYLLNAIIAGIFIIMIILLNFLLYSINEEYRPFIFILIGTPCLLFSYIFVNISHALFYRGHSIKDSPKKSFTITFTKIKIYREIILVIILFALFLSFLLFGAGYLIQIVASRNFSLYLRIYSYFTLASIISLYTVLYLVILINRISFYAIIMNDKSE